MFIRVQNKNKPQRLLCSRGQGRAVARILCKVHNLLIQIRTTKIYKNCSPEDTYSQAYSTPLPPIFASGYSVTTLKSSGFPMGALFAGEGIIWLWWYILQGTCPLTPVHPPPFRLQAERKHMAGPCDLQPWWSELAAVCAVFSDARVLWQDKNSAWSLRFWELTKREGTFCLPFHPLLGPRF